MRGICFCLFVFTLIGVSNCYSETGLGSESHYDTYDEMTIRLIKLHLRYPDMVTVYSIGKSVKKKEILAVKITKLQSPSAGTPNVKYVAGVHGSEALGTQLLLYLAEHLVMESDQGEISELLNTTVVHLLPLLNPDGFELAIEGECTSNNGMANANGFNLDVNFPNYLGLNQSELQPETLAVMNWMKTIPFVLSASLHSSGVFAGYPFRLRNEEGNSKTPDDDTFQHLAKSFAENHLTMSQTVQCPQQKFVPGGVMNTGSEWNEPGAMEDYNYLEHGCMELLVGLSCCDYPVGMDLGRLWRESQPALVSWLKEAHKGVRGIVVNAKTEKPISRARLIIEGRNATFFSDKTGQFWRILRPGTYQLKAQAKGYKPEIYTFTVKEEAESFSKATWLDVRLVEIYPQMIRSSDALSPPRVVPDVTEVPENQTETTEYVRSNASSQISSVIIFNSIFNACLALLRLP